MNAALPWRLSPSALGRFRACERQFLLVDVERLGRRGEERHPLLAQGSAIHAALERFFGLRPEDRLPPGVVLQQALRSVWRTHWKPEAYPNPDMEIDFGCRALAMLAAFPDCFDTTAQPFAREQWVKALLPNGFELCGRIDRIDGIEDGVDLIDYKTGKRRLDECDLSRDPAAQVYALAAEATFGLPVYRVRHLYLASGEEIAWWPERDDLEVLADTLAELTDRISLSEFPASPGAHCGFCPVALGCPERGRVEIDDLTASENLPF